MQVQVPGQQPESVYRGPAWSLSPGAWASYQEQPAGGGAWRVAGGGWKPSESPSQPLAFAADSDGRGGPGWQPVQPGPGRQSGLRRARGLRACLRRRRAGRAQARGPGAGEPRMLPTGGQLGLDRGKGGGRDGARAPLLLGARLGPTGMLGFRVGTDSSSGGSSDLGFEQLAGRGAEERTPTRMVIFGLGKSFLENYAVS